MKRLYWRPRKCSKAALLLIGLTALVGILVVERMTLHDRSEAGQLKLSAARLARRSMDVVKEERLERGHAIDPQLDPTGSGLIGATMTPITSVAGHLGSKQTSINPNFAAMVVQLLVDAGVQSGDCVAVGYSGSFPCINLAVCAALETMQAEPIAIASAAASQYGANFPDLMWIDMERILHERGLIHFRSAAASIGGYEDAGLGMSDEGRQLVCEAIQRNDLPLLRADSFQDAIHRRMEIYRLRAGDRPIKAYINIGGGTISTGRALGKKMYQPGLNMEPPAEAARIDSVMNRFALSGTPVIHMVQIPQLAAAHGMPSAPQTLPEVGSGSVHAQPRYNRWLAAAVLVVILFTLRSVVLTGVRRQIDGLMRLVGWPGKAGPVKRPDLGGELMV